MNCLLRTTQTIPNNCHTADRIYSIRFSEDEQAAIEQYALLCGIKISEVIRKATIEMIEDEMNIQTFKDTRKRFENNLVTCSREDVGKELGFLCAIESNTAMMRRNHRQI